MSGVAVIGMGCRYPDAGTPGELWENVLSQRRSFRRLPPERLRLDDYYASDPRAPDAIYADHAALLEDWEFDRVAFRITGPAFRSTDLTHWLALEVADAALADARLDQLREVDRDRVSVVVGNTLTGEFSRSNVMRLRWPYVRRVLAPALERAGLDGAARARALAEIEREYKRPFPPIGEESLAGALSNTIAGRICNRFDLHGGGYTVDGACASSLLAIITACTALAAGDADLVVAGGVDLSIDPFELVGFAKTGALAADLMRVYDRRSAGFWPGEGCGFVVLARHEDALDWRAHVHAVIRGWGVSSDGRGGVTRPEPEGQLIAIRRAYARAGYGASSVELFEGHGTGTAVGDVAEIRALTRACAEAGRRGGAAALGTIKANIGHTKAAAGVAGLLKAIHAVDRRILPPTTGVEAPHPELATHDDPPLRLLREPEPWPEGRPARAGVSAMGFGGVNTHVTVEAAVAGSGRGLTRRERRLAVTHHDAELVPLAAATAADLATAARELAGAAAGLSFGGMRDLAIGACADPPQGAVRAAVVAARPAELAARLEQLAAVVEAGATRSLDQSQGFALGDGGDPRIGFLFPGQAAPTYLDGGAVARRFPWLRELLDPALPAPEPDLTSTRVAQPAIAACSAAGDALLDALGVQARVAVGHSLGELAALRWAGVMDHDELAALAALRGRAMAACPGDSGAMVELRAGAGDAAALADGLEVGVAALNAPDRTVLSGTSGAVDALAARAEARGIRATRLPVSHAFHSPLVAPAAAALDAHLAGVELRPARRTVVSTVLGAPLGPDADVRDLLVRQVTEPVRFAEALAAAADGVDLWIEVGPGRILTGLARDAGLAAVATDAGGPSLAGVLTAAGAAWALGAPVDLPRLAEDRVRRDADPLRPRSYLVNPCELAPVGDGAAMPPSAPSAADGDGDGAIDGAVETAAATPEELVRRLVARRAELPLEAVAPGARLLTDLNLNSIAIGEIAAQGARELGVRPPLSPTDLADATVADLAAVLAQSEPDDGAGAGAPAGVAAWLRPFTVEWSPRRAPVDDPVPCAWSVVAPDGHPLAGRLREAFGSDSQQGGDRQRAVVVAPGPGRTVADAAWLLGALRSIARDGGVERVLVVHDGGGGAGVRTLFLEHDRLAVRVVELATDPAPETLRAVRVAAETGDGFAELRLDATGAWLEPELRRTALAPPDPDRALGPDDVLLATGAGKGIGAETALALAQGSGAKVGVVGRSDPAEDEELRGNLERLRRAGVAVHYARADAADAAQVGAAVRAVEEALGPVTAVLHAAGVNEPRLLADMDEEAVRRTVAPKVDGLRHLLAAVDPARLRLLLAFGSIIARAGMRGEAHYALANEWLRLAMEDAAAALPRCRTAAIEFSVWSGAGMGERLGRMEALAREGIMPIAPEDGTELVRRVATAASAPATLVACGRLGEQPTLRLERAELPLTRFLERPLVHYPRTELVVECTLSTETDPYLTDHALGGIPLLPAVVGFEAMAQVASALAGSPVRAIGDVALQRPITVPADGPREIRVAALAGDDGRVDVAIRSAETGFDVDHFRATCTTAAPPGATAAPAPPGDAPATLGDELYGRLLFHGPRFRRVAGYRHLSARRCVAEVRTDPGAPWFSAYLPQELMLGDLGARDAFIHAAQACIPHRRVLPLSVEEIRFLRPLAATAVVRAEQRWATEDELCYDLVVEDEDGEALESWRGLVLRAVEPLPAPAAWSPDVFAAYLERRVSELVPAAEVRAALVDGARPRADRTAAAARRIAGPGVALHHRGDGKPELDDGSAVSIAHHEPYTLAVGAGAAVACDLEAVAPRPADLWTGMLGPERLRVAERLAAEAGEELDVAATRLWVASECLRKAGRPPGEQVTLDRVAGDGWAVLRAAGAPLVVGVVRLDGAPEPVAVGVLAREGGA